jgi:hypothetical protein
MLHEEIDHISALSGAETLINAFRRGNIERSVPLVGERAESLIILPAFLQLDKFPDNLLHPGSFKYSCYGLLGDQIPDALMYKDNMLEKKGMMKILT